MAFDQNRIISIHGRQLGLEIVSTGKSGGRLERNYLVGAEDWRKQHSTAETTGTNVDPFGYSVLTTAVSSGVYVLDPPIPGVEKTVVFHTTGANPIYLKTKNNETIGTTQNTSGTVITSSQTAYAAIKLVAVSTGAWAALGSISSAFLKLSTST